MDIFENLKKKLLDMESPFVWHLPDSNLFEYNFIQARTEKLQGIEEESDFKWNKLILNLLLSYETCVKLCDYKLALKHIEDCGVIVTAAKNAKCKESLFISVQSILEHVIDVSRAVILLESRQYDQTKHIVGRLQQLQTEKAEVNAGLLGLKAAVFLQYSTDGHKKALELAREACTLDKSQAEWWFIRGNALGRIRRYKFEIPISNEEIIAVERANQLHKDASYTVHMAQLYANLSQQFNYKEPAKATLYAKESIDMFMKSLEMRPNCGSLKARVIHGLVRIPVPKLIKKVIKEVKALIDDFEQKSTNNPMVLHDLGYYYNKFEKDHTKAILYLKKSAEFGNLKAVRELINIKWKHGLHDQIIPYLEHIQIIDTSKEFDLAMVYAELGICYILTRDDWISAIKYFKKSLLTETTGKYLKKYWSYSGYFVNLLEMIVEYLRRTSTDQQFRSFVNFVVENRPEVTRKNVKYNFESWKKDQFKVVKK